MRVLSTLAIRAGLLVVTLPKCAKWLIGDSFLFRSEMCESRSLRGEVKALPVLAPDAERFLGRAVRDAEQHGLAPRPMRMALPRRNDEHVAGRPFQRLAI